MLAYVIDHTLTPGTGQTREGWLVVGLLFALLAVC